MYRIALMITCLALLVPLVFLHGCSRCNGPAPDAEQQPAQPASAAPRTPAPPLLSDAELQTLIDKINAMNQAVRSYTCTWDGSEISTGGGVTDGPVREIAHHEERAFKRPQMFKATITQVKGLVLGTTGQTQEYYADGTTLWQYTPTPSAAGAKLAAAIRKDLSDAEKAEMIQRREAPRAYRKDINRLREAGLWDEKIWPAMENLLSPFSMCDMNRLKLESEDADTWVFVARPAAHLSAEYRLIRTTIGKADGIMRKRQCVLVRVRGENMQQVSNLVLNPDLPDAMFTFSPPEGTEIVDRTDEEINAGKRKGS